MSKNLTGWIDAILCCVNNSAMMGRCTYVMLKILKSWVAAVSCYEWIWVDVCGFLFLICKT